MIAAEHCKQGDAVVTRSLRMLAFVAFLAGGPLSAVEAFAQSPDPSDIADGMRLFRQKGNCQACHGWAADGRKMDSQMPDGKDLRETGLDRDNLVTTIKWAGPAPACRPSTASPIATAAAMG